MGLATELEDDAPLIRDGSLTEPLAEEDLTPIPPFALAVSSFD